MTFLFAIVLK